MSQPPAERVAGRTRPTRERLFTGSFLLASVMTLASFSSFYLLMATLPIYIMRPPIGGTESEVGLIIGILSLAAVILRPLVGKGTDDFGKRPFILVGSVLFALASGLYGLMTTVPMLLALRVFHGVGWASSGTATNALIADLAPRSRRGEAMGYYGMFSNLAMAVGPALGVVVMTSYGFPVLFGASAALAVVALLLSLGIREPERAGSTSAPSAPIQGAAGPFAPLPAPGTSPLETVRQTLRGAIERTAVFPSAVFTLTAVTYGSIVSFVPIYAGKQGIENPGVFFTVYAITLLASRSFTGQLSDRYGRAAVIVPGLGFAAAALWLLSFATALPAFLGAAVLYGLAFGAIQPALMALVVDRAAPNRRGAAMGTFSTAMDLGILVGSVMWGYVAQAAGYHTMYLASGGVALTSLAVFLIGIRPRGASNPAAK